MYWYTSAGTPYVPGKKKALLIGINYANMTQGRLSGCVNDVRNMKAFLEKNYGFNSFMILTDEPPLQSETPTKANILKGIRWLVADAAPGDSLFFQFSGHGSQVADTSGDEDDGYDETICPLDYRTAGQIIDDDLHRDMCMKIPAGCRLTAVMDCCMFSPLLVTFLHRVSLIYLFLDFSHYFFFIIFF